MAKNITDTKADFIKAIANPTRIEILEILREGEKCVCELIPKLGLEQSNVSQHLGILREQGIIEYRKEGLQVYYRIKDRRILRLLAIVDEILVRRLEEMESTLGILRGAK